MSIARALGVEDIDGLLMTSAREAWSRWIADDPALGVVDNLVELPRWLKRAEPARRNMPIARLATLAVADLDAAVALAWLLIPRAKGIARRLADTSADIDALVAGQLWIEIRDGNPPSAYVASTIMRNVEKAVMAELGIGDAGARADKTWAVTSVRDRVGDVCPGRTETPELQRVLRVVLQSLMDTGDIEITEAQTLASVAGHADWLSKPMRGRAGLTSPDVLEVLTWLEPTKARTMRREVGKLLDRVAAAAADLDVLDLLERHPDDGVTFQDWALGLGRPRHAQAAARFREFELAAIRFHNATWDPEAGVCGVPALCPECIRAEVAA